MLHSANGKIFLAGARSHAESDWFRSYGTLPANLGCGPLYAVTDNTLAGGKSFVQFAEQAFELLLLPTVGAVVYSDSAGQAAVVEAGEAQQIQVPKGTTFELKNPYDDDLVNFLQLWLKPPAANATPSKTVSFNLERDKNTLVPLFSAPHQTFIAKFDGRQEAVYDIQTAGNGVFVFVIEGAFEVQYRLLETRDGLALWNTPAIELEALSNGALILLLELPLAA